MLATFSQLQLNPLLCPNLHTWQLTPTNANDTPGLLMVVFGFSFSFSFSFSYLYLILIPTKQYLPTYLQNVLW